MTARPKPPIGALPYWPRLLDADQAAAYVGLGKNSFLGQVEAGIFAAPVRLGKRALWDRLQIDRDVDRLGGHGARVLTEEDLLKVVGGQHEVEVDALRHPPS